MRKFLTLTFILGLALVCLAGCGNSEQTNINNTQSEDGNISGVPNPRKSHETLSSLEEAVGFEILEPKKLKEYSKEYVSINYKTAEIIYTLPDGSSVAYRIKEGEHDDISGVYTDFAKTETMTEEPKANLRGNSDNRFYIADWTKDEKTYSIYVNIGAAKDTLEQYVISVY